MPRISLIRLWQLVKKECKQLLRDPKAKPILLVSPVVQFILLAYASTTDVEHIRTVLLDQDRSADSRAMVQAYQAAGYFDFTAQVDGPEGIIGGLDAGTAVLGLIIPPGFSRELRSGKGAVVQALIDGSDASVATVAQSYVSQVAEQFGAKVRPSLHRPAGIELRARAWFNPSLESRMFNVPAIMGTLLLTTCLMLTTMCLVREREVGTLDQLLVSPIGATEIMIGKMLPILGVGLFHLTIFASITLWHFHVPFRGTVVALGLAALLFLLAALAIGLMISALSSTQQEAFMLMILLMLPMVILSGMLSPIETMPEALQWATLVNPIRHFLFILRGIFLKGTGLAELWPQYAAMAAITTTALALATNRFRQSIA
jgi:drug efflux transport system permease protein